MTINSESDNNGNGDVNYLWERSDFDLFMAENDEHEGDGGEFEKERSETGSNINGAEISEPEPLDNPRMTRPLATEIPEDEGSSLSDISSE